MRARKMTTDEELAECERVRGALEALKRRPLWRYRMFCANIVEWRAPAKDGRRFKIQAGFRSEEAAFSLTVGYQEDGSVYNFKDARSEVWGKDGAESFKLAIMSWLCLTAEGARVRYDRNFKKAARAG